MPLLLLLLSWPTLESKQWPAETQELGFTATVRVQCLGMKGIGSGVIIESKEDFTHILTAAHLFGSFRQATVEGFAKDSYPEAKWQADAQLLWAEKDTDLALIRIRTPRFNLRPIPLAEAVSPRESPRHGLQIGCEAGLPPRALEVQILGRKLVDRGQMSEAFFWETTPPAESGRSGGPMLNSSGELIGIASGIQNEKGYLVHLDEIRASLKRHPKK
jgi:S1-C subfamily serine protease